MSNSIATTLGGAQDTPSTSVGILPAPLPDLTPKQDLFAQAYVETGNMSLAYRRSYEVGVNTKPQTVWREAQNVAAIPQVRARIDALREAAAAHTVASKAQLLTFLWRRITADRGQLINHVMLCCRHCYGVDHKFQWTDQMEYADACVQAAQQMKAMPDYSGGFGFNPHLPPAATCNHDPCFGFGQGRTVITDTTTLAGDAALLYEGVKETEKGIEIKVADRNADIALFLKLTGWGSDELEGMLRGAAAGGAAGAVAAQAVVEKVKTMNSDDTRRAYLTMIGG